MKLIATIFAATMIMASCSNGASNSTSKTDSTKVSACMDTCKMKQTTDSTKIMPKIDSSKKK